ncbi:MAG: hypothetical protein JXQ73_10015 [Phycisphaerae bacterium]|nr:hypothetical protein [Phycisphaerae bacterium]
MIGSPGPGKMMPRKRKLTMVQSLTVGERSERFAADEVRSCVSVGAADASPPCPEEEATPPRPGPMRRDR